LGNLLAAVVTKSPTFISTDMLSSPNSQIFNADLTPSETVLAAAKAHG